MSEMGEAAIAQAIARAEEPKADMELKSADEQPGDRTPGSNARATKQAVVLIELASELVLFHDQDEAGYADAEIHGHRETWPIRANECRAWLQRRYYEETGGAPNAEALKSAIDLLEAKARFEGELHRVHVRVADHHGRCYVDLADEAWRAIEIDIAGWRLVERPPVRFRRRPGMRALPAPRRGGSLEDLRGFLNLASDADFVLVVSWIVAAMRSFGPYPLLVLSGEQGSAKSTFCALVKALVDPNEVPLRTLPREERDLYISACRTHVLVFDNISVLPDWLSDTLCRIATGGGFATRRLYSDDDEMLFRASRPIIINGIEEVVGRPDLADRSIFLHLEPLAEEGRRPEQELWSAFGEKQPLILGALLDAFVGGLNHFSSVQLDRLPRMADFARWAAACENGLWPGGIFAQAYAANRAGVVQSMIEADAIATAVIALMAEHDRWEGTATDLLERLGARTSEPVRKSKQWPATARSLAGRLKRAATVLRKMGIEVETGIRKGRLGTRLITLIRVADNAG